MDIIALFLLAYFLKNRVRRKGQDLFKWRLRLVVLWIAFEILGLFIGYSISHDLLRAGLLGLCMAVGAYVLVRYQLDRLPDVKDNWMDRIGRE